MGVEESPIHRTSGLFMPFRGKSLSKSVKPLAFGGGEGGYIMRCQAAGPRTTRTSLATVGAPELAGAEKSDRNRSVSFGVQVRRQRMKTQRATYMFLGMIGMMGLLVGYLRGGTGGYECSNNTTATYCNPTSCACPGISGTCPETKIESAQLLYDIVPSADGKCYLYHEDEQNCYKVCTCDTSGHNCSLIAPCSLSATCPGVWVMRTGKYTKQNESCAGSPCQSD